MKKPKKEKVFDLKIFIQKELRRSFKKTPMYREAKAKAREEFFVQAKNGNMMRRVHYKCATCGKFFFDKPGAKEIAVDHIEPVISTKDGYQNFTTYIERLFCSVDNLQVICNYKGERDGLRSCHKIKTKLEQEDAARNRRIKNAV